MDLPSPARAVAPAPARLSSLLWIVLGAAILLAPAALWGRPFVFWDTPNYWGWGRDIVAAAQHPWPGPGAPWIAGRPFYGWEVGANGATANDLRFDLTMMTARSAFYAVPLYLLLRAGGLWLVAGVQSLICAAAIKASISVLAPGGTGLTYLAIVAALAVTSSLGFEAAYAMPDVFGGLALLAAGVLIVCHDRLALPARLGFLGLLVYAVVAHAENGWNVAAAVVLGALGAWRTSGRWRLALARVAPVAAALAVGVGAGAGGSVLLTTIFRQPAHFPPYAAARVLADGSAQRYLQTHCGDTQPLAACDLANPAPTFPEYYLFTYPLEGPPPPGKVGNRGYDRARFERLRFMHVTDAEAAQRDRFVAEQPALVLGALQADPVRQARAALVNILAVVVDFAVNRDFDSFQGPVLEHTQRAEQIVSIAGANHYGRFDIRDVAPIEDAAFIAALGFLYACLLWRRAAPVGELADFVVLVLALLLVNAVVCGALSGPYERYQTRVEWLAPFAALLVLAQWALRDKAPAAPAKV